MEAETARWEGEGRRKVHDAPPARGEGVEHVVDREGDDTDEAGEVHGLRPRVRGRQVLRVSYLGGGGGLGFEMAVGRYGGLLFTS